MNLIKDIEIDHFRSIHNKENIELGNFTTISGLNNSGKSNILRALNMFFKGKPEPDLDFDFNSDYSRFDLKSKKKAKDIRVKLSFKLPDHFNFRAEFNDIKNLLGNEFSLTKSWSRVNTSNKYFLNDIELNYEDKYLIDKFLSLINFRYIPNRVLPLDIVRDEHSALRDAIVRRLRTRLGKQDDLFAKLKETSEALVGSIDKELKSSTNVDSIRLDMPSSWKDFIFAFGYKLTSGGIEFDDTQQGSGIQSLLMLQTLALIDKDYFQRFGWKQASIWAIEEPESSMHTSLEAHVALLLSKLANEDNGRLQIIGSTHSDIMVQYSDSLIIVDMKKGRSSCQKVDKYKGLVEISERGISRFSHPLLAEPIHPLIIVEGESDYNFLSQALKLLAPNKDFRVSFLKKIFGINGAVGGVENLDKYIKYNQQILSSRLETAPIIVLLDWDASNKVSNLQKYCDNLNKYKVLSWPISTFNPNLGDVFKGIERHLSNRIIELANNVNPVLAQKSNGEWTCSEREYNSIFKHEVNKVLKQGILLEDLEFVRDFLISDILTI